MPINLGSPWDVRTRIGACLRHRLFDAFFKAPMKIGRRRGLQIYHLILLYSYSSIVAFFLWVVPWSGLLIWYLAIIQGCQWNPTRGLLQEICHQSLPSHEVPWYLDLWNAQGNSANNTDAGLPLYIERLMIGHDRLKHASRALGHQISKTESTAHLCMTDDLLKSLRT